MRLLNFKMKVKFDYLKMLPVTITCLFFVINFNSYGVNYKIANTYFSESINRELDSKFILMFECQGFLFTFSSIENNIVVYDLIHSSIVSDFKLKSSVFNGVYILDNRFFVSLNNDNVYELWEMEIDMKRMMLMDLSIEEMECIKIPELGRIVLDKNDRFN